MAEAFVFLLWAILFGILYGLPSIVAFRRLHPNRWIIFAINLAFGATVIGWVGCLVWAFNAAHRTNIAGGSDGGESGLNIFVNDVKRVVLHQSEPRTPHPAFHTQTIHELERLSDLRTRDLLTPEEYQRLKTDVLSRVNQTT